MGGTIFLQCLDIADFFLGGTLQRSCWHALHKQSEQAGREQVNKSPDIRNVKESESRISEF